MSEVIKPEVSATGFAPHIEELHEFFRSRGVSFGKPEELKPFVERIQNDESFRDQMASMVRAIIYRERDGLMPAELLELMVAAVTGRPAEDAPEQDQDAVRQTAGFVSGVFRSRWTPGGSVAATSDKADADVDVAAGKASAAAMADAAASATADAAARPMTPIFYQAQVVANGGEEPVLNDRDAGAEAAAEPLAGETKAAKTPEAGEKTKAAKAIEAAKAEEVVLPLRGKSEGGSEPFLSLAGYAAQPEPVAAFLRDDDKSALALAGTEPKRSSGWGWAVAILAVVVAFGAGMYTRQLMFARYGAAWPWPWHLRTTPATAAAPSPPAVRPAANAGGVLPPTGGAVGGQDGKAAPSRRPAQVEAARSEWKGGSESAMDEPHAASSSSAHPAGGVTAQPMMGLSKPSTEGDTSVVDSGEARATAMSGASPGLMESHLLFAPEPQYPEAARIAHIQGRVVVEALVGRDGSVVRAHAISGQQALRGPAEKAVSGRRYRPYVVNDIPMAMRTLVTVNFPPR